MLPFFKHLKLVVRFTTAILAGLFLFFILMLSNINTGVLSSNFHKQLFEKHSIYTQAQNVVDHSMKGFIDNLKKNSSESYDLHKSTFALLENSLTPGMIRMNLDALREGIFQYFRGERIFLPDIYLNPVKTNDTSSSGNTSPQVLSKIDKVNLSAVLLYINRSDITDRLLILKLVYYLAETLPGFSLLALLLLFLGGLVFCKKVHDVVNWIGTTLFTCGVLCVLTGITLLIYTYIIMPHNIYPVAASIPLQSNVIVSYLQDLFVHTSILLLIPGVIIFLLSWGVFSSYKRFPSALTKEHTPVTESEHKVYVILKYSVYFILFIFIITATGYRFYSFKKDFESNDFPAAISKIKNANTVTQVISAKNDAIYTLQVKIVEGKSGKPVKGLKINVSGKSDPSKKDFNENSTTDEEGMAKLTLDKGSFRLSFISAFFPSEYQIPSPFFFDLKSAGTMIMTINLDNTPEIASHRWGIAEVEVLDKDNKPVPNIKSTIDGMVFAPGYPNNIFSYTNPEGIAVFKIDEGYYKVNFLEKGFPQGYILPSPIDVTVSYNAVTRYTIRLAESKEVKSGLKTSPDQKQQ